MKTYNNLKKRSIQKTIFSSFKIDSNALILGGPNFKNYVKFISKEISKSKLSKINSYEVDNNTLSLQIKDYRKFNNELARKVSINFGDIKKAKAERFIDLDLMGNINTQGHIIKSLFIKQKLIKSNLNKVFMFTVCLRKADYLTVFSFLKELLGVNIILLEKKSVINGVEYVIKHKSLKYNIQIYSYKDGSPMLTCCINY